MAHYTIRTVRLIFGLFLFALGTYLSIQANIGLAPWSALSAGLSSQTGLSFGNVEVITGLTIILADLALKEKIGFGTLLNALLIGKFIDLIAWANLIPRLTSFWPGLFMLLAGQVVVCFGSYYYIGAGFSCGPRDSLMVGLARRLPRIPIGVIRGSIEATALFVGWLLGAKVGLGTVITVFGIGFFLQVTFQLLRFDVKSIIHESFADTLRRKPSIPQPH